MYYGNNSNGWGYSPDRSKDVDRFNYSTKANYYTANNYGKSWNNTNDNKSDGYYDGRGIYHHG